MNQTNTHNINNIIIIVVHIYTQIARCPRELISCSEIHRAWPHSVCGHAPHHGACPHKNILLHFAKYLLFLVETTLVTCIRSMFTHSECEISQSWRTQFSSHGAFNLNRADIPLLPLSGFSCPPFLNEFSGASVFQFHQALRSDFEVW